MLSKQLLVAFSVSLLSQVAVGGTSGYQCLVQTELHLTAEGKLEPYPRPLELGKRFAIDRKTGILVETSASFWSPTDAQVSVLAHGNKDNSFVVSYVAPSAGGGVHATVLRVEEFSQSAKKPFSLTSGSSVYAGVCE